MAEKFDYGYENMKIFEKRVTIESKKVKDLAASMLKAKALLESEKKAYCVEFKK